MSDDSVIEVAQTLLAQYAEEDWFWGTVLIARGGRPIFEASAGWADQEMGQANTAQTRYHLGSLMKNFTTVLVLQQIEAGNLSLDDTLDQFDLGFRDSVAEDITIAHLLAHESGFPGAFPARYRENPLAFETLEQKLALYRDTKLLFEPGTERLYSNYGFIVLGAVLEAVAQKPFAGLLQAQILEPLGLANTAYPLDPNAHQQSKRYTYDYRKTQVPVGWVEHHSPDGGLEATASDVLRFYQALFDEPSRLSISQDLVSRYFPTDGGYWASYGGGLGASSAVEIDINNDWQVMVLANTDQWVAEEMSQRIMAWIGMGEYEPVRIPPLAFAWVVYERLGADGFAASFKDLYAEAGYSLFMGRVINQLGLALAKDQQFSDAKVMMNILISFFPNAPEAYDSLAYVRWQAGEYGEACRAFGRALAIQADFSSDYLADGYRDCGVD